MALLNEKIVLDFYLEQIKEDNVKFLQGRETYRREIEESIKALRDEANMHGRIQHAKTLWKQLFDAAMSFINRDKRGYDDLFSYFDEYVNFEELIFASDAFYRDHTLHCLWVYFLGEYVKRHEDFKDTFDSGESEGINLMTRLVETFEKSIHADSFKRPVSMFKRIITMLHGSESIRCISALSHDLGYPLKKIGKINKSIRSILPYFAINNYDEFNFNYSVIQQNYINDFLKLLVDEVSVNTFSTSQVKKNKDLFDKIFSIGEDINDPFKVDVEVLDKLTEEELGKIDEMATPEVKIAVSYTEHARYASDFEQYEHGIMSAFLLMRTINSFNTLKYTYYDNVNINPDNIDFVRIYAISETLCAIANHTSPRYQITDLTGYSEFLILMDELEEFSRISRANQNRQFVTEFCKTDIYMEDGRFNVDFIFDNENFDGIDPEKAFKGKCKRFLNLFDIPNIKDNVKIRIRCIGKLPYDNNIYSLEISKQYADITINGEEQNIPKYLKSKVFYTKEEYMANI